MAPQHSFLFDLPFRFVLGTGITAGTVWALFKPTDVALAEEVSKKPKVLVRTASGAVREYLLRADSTYCLAPYPEHTPRTTSHPPPKMASGAVRPSPPRAHSPHTLCLLWSHAIALSRLPHDAPAAPPWRRLASANTSLRISPACSSAPDTRPSRTPLLSSPPKTLSHVSHFSCRSPPSRLRLKSLPARRPPSHLPPATRAQIPPGLAGSESENSYTSRMGMSKEYKK